eukprot:220230-Pyramimonas_sp.AAC.1
MESRENKTALSILELFQKETLLSMVGFVVVLVVVLGKTCSNYMGRSRSRFGAPSPNQNSA